MLTQIAKLISIRKKPEPKPEPLTREEEILLAEYRFVSAIKKAEIEWQKCRAEGSKIRPWIDWPRKEILVTESFDSSKNNRITIHDFDNIEDIMERSE